MIAKVSSDKLINRGLVFKKDDPLAARYVLVNVPSGHQIPIWTRDRRLGEVADELGLRAPLP